MNCCNKEGQTARVVASISIYFSGFFTSCTDKTPQRNPHFIAVYFIRTEGKEADDIQNKKRKYCHLIQHSKNMFTNWSHLLLHCVSVERTFISNLYIERFHKTNDQCKRTSGVCSTTITVDWQNCLDKYCKLDCNSKLLCVCIFRRRDEYHSELRFYV